MEFLIKALSNPQMSKRFAIYMLLSALLLSSCGGRSYQVNSQLTATTNPAYWTPAAGDILQIQYSDYPPDLTVEADILALDLFETPQEIIDELHAQDKRVICYLNTGSWEEYRPDADEFPAEVIGKDYEGWPGEKWLDISRYGLFADIIQKRFDLAAQKVCDGIDADNMHNYQNDTGFDITAADQLAYNTWLSEQAHQRGMSIGLKNDAEQVAELVEYFDWSLVEECHIYGWCDLLVPFTQSAKPVFQVEYTEEGTSLISFCPAARLKGFSGLLKHRDLDAWVKFCPKGNGLTRIFDNIISAVQKILKMAAD